MKSKVLILFILSSLISCDKEGIEPLLSDEYFPLSVGNSWTFELAGTDSVIKMRNIDGKEYFDLANEAGTIQTFRRERNKVYELLDSTEVMIFNLAAKKNDTWEYGNGMVELVSRNENVFINDTVIANCLRFNFYSAEIPDYGYSVWLAPNLGYVQKNCQECFGAAFKTIKLKKAKIDIINIDLK